MGDRIRLGTVPAKNVRATANGEFVASYTNAASAIWLTRSPNRLMTWPVHSAENDGFSASRTYGCSRKRSGRRGRGRTIVPALVVGASVGRAVRPGDAIPT